MIMDYWERERVKQGGALHLCSCAQHCRHLRYLGCDLRIVPCSTGLSKCFFFPQYISSCWVTRSIWPHVGGTTVNTSSVSSRLSVQPHGASWGGNLTSVSVLLPLFSKIGSLCRWDKGTCEDLLLLQDTLQTLQGTLQTLQEHLQGRGWQRTHRKVSIQALPLSFGWESCTLSHKLWLIKYKPIQFLI